MVYKENIEVFKAISDRFVKFDSLYPAETKALFKSLVLEHMTSLDDTYWETMRCYPGKVVFEDVNNGKVISREQVVNEYVTEAAVKVCEYLDSFKDSEVIGGINGRSLFFSHKTGYYFYSGHDESIILLEICISGGVYPPGY